MLREYQTILDKNINAMATATTAMVTGMGAQYNPIDQTFAPPTATSAENIYIVNKERIATGIYAAYSDLSDYDEEYVNIAEGEKAKLIPMHGGERYGTDQYADGLTEGCMLAVGTDGKWCAADGASRFQHAGIALDANLHELLIIQVLDTAVSA